MAAKTSIKITSDTSEFKKSLEEGKKATSSFTRELRNAKNDALNLTKEFRSLSDELKNSDYGRNLERQMQDAIRKAGELQDTFGDVHDEINNFASDTQFADGMKLMTSTVGSLGTAVVALTGDSENMKKVLMDIAKIQATAQAVKALTDAFQKQNRVLLANPYVLVATAITGLGFAIYECSKSAKDSKKDLEDYKKALKEISTAANLAKYSLNDLKQMAANNAKVQGAESEIDNLDEQINEIKNRQLALSNLKRTKNRVKEYEENEKAILQLKKQQDFQRNLIRKYQGENELIEDTYKKREEAANKAAEAERRANTPTTYNNTPKQRDPNEELREALQLEKEIKAETKYDVYDFLGGAAPDFRGQFSTEQMKPTALVEEVDDDKLDFTSVLENDWVAVDTLKEIIKELNDEMGKAKTPEAYKKYAEQVEEATTKMEEETKKTGESKDSQNKLQKQLQKTSKVANQVGNAFSTLGNAFELPALNIMGVIGQAIANTALAFGDALAKDQTSKTNIFAFIAASVSAVATMATLISQIKSITSGYANGGIIQGATTIGDLNLARVNDGEMILNGRQQKNLFNMLNNGIERQPVSLDTTNVEFRLRGQELIGVIKNTDKKMSKI